MNKIDKIKVNNLIHSLGLKYNLKDEEIKQLVESQFEFAKIKMKELDLRHTETQEEFDKLKTNFMFRSFFKLVTNFGIVKGINYYRNKYIEENK